MMLFITTSQIPAVKLKKCLKNVWLNIKMDKYKDTSVKGLKKILKKLKTQEDADLNEITFYDLLSSNEQSYSQQDQDENVITSNSLTRASWTTSNMFSTEKISFFLPFQC